MKTNLFGGPLSAFQGWQALIIGLLASIAILVIAVLVSSCFAETRSDWAAWVQATGSVMAIVAGFSGVLYQVAEQRLAQAREIEALGRAAHTLAGSALDLVTRRLEAALRIEKSPSIFFLRGLRTTEMVTAMREFQAGSLPTSLIPSFTTLRACVFAINERISELYAEEAPLEGEAKAAVVAKRPSELESAVRVHAAAITAFVELDRLATEKCAARAISVDPLAP